MPLQNGGSKGLEEPLNLWSNFDGWWCDKRCLKLEIEAMEVKHMVEVLRTNCVDLQQVNMPILMYQHDVNL